MGTYVLLTTRHGAPGPCPNKMPRFRSGGRLGDASFTRSRELQASCLTLSDVAHGAPHAAAANTDCHLGPIFQGSSFTGTGLAPSHPPSLPFSLLLSLQASSLCAHTFLLGKNKHNQPKPVLAAVSPRHVGAISSLPLMTQYCENRLHVGFPLASHPLIP